METKFSRLAASLGLVVGLTVVTTLAARGTRKPFTLDGPDSHRQGPADAKVAIVEFSDFQCPSCRAAEPPLKRILSLYDGKVHFLFKHYPLVNIHPWAMSSA